MTLDKLNSCPNLDTERCDMKRHLKKIYNEYSYFFDTVFVILMMLIVYIPV